jgi:putative transposase
MQKCKRFRVGASTLPGDRHRAAFSNHVWALDFQFNQRADARILKLLNITDEFTKTSLAIEMGGSSRSDDMVRILELLVTVHGTPMFIRMDNGH